MNIGLRDYVHCNTEVETCISRDYGITGLQTFWTPSISNYEHKIRGLRTLYSRNRNLFFLGLRDYVRCNPEVETCNPRDYGITGLHILAALNLKL